MGTWLFSIGEKESVFLGLLNLLNRRRIQVSMCHQQKCPKLTLHEDLDAQFQYLDRFFFLVPLDYIYIRSGPCLMGVSQILYQKNSTAVIFVLDLW